MPPSSQEATYEVKHTVDVWFPERKHEFACHLIASFPGSHTPNFHRLQYESWGREPESESLPRMLQHNLFGSSLNHTPR